MLLPRILSAVLEALAEYWRDQAILAAPDASWDPLTVAQANGVVLPADFVHLYHCSNGMSLQLYQDFDKEYFYFFSAEELRTEQRELVIVSGQGVETSSAKVTVFVDYMHCSWQYAFIPNATGDGYQIGIMPNPNEFKVITTSLATFLSLYMEDALVLYDYRNPYTNRNPATDLA